MTTKRKTGDQGTRKKSREDEDEQIDWLHKVTAPLKVLLDTLEKLSLQDDSLRTSLGRLQAVVMDIELEIFSAESLNLLETPLAGENENDNVKAIRIDINERLKRVSEAYKPVFEASIRGITYEEGDMSDLFKDRDEAMQDAVDAIAPSDAAKLDYLEEELESHPMKIGRPFEATGPPIYIYHPVFWQFHKLANDQSSTPTPEDVNAAFSLMVVASTVYETETLRLNAVLPEIQNLLGRSLHGTLGSYPYRLDGIIQTGHLGRDAPLLVIEAKNEIGTGQSDPAVQGSFSFRKLWTQDSLSALRNVSCCPSFLLSMAGPNITIQGGVLTDTFIVQPLTETLGLANFPNPYERAQQIARVMVALRTSLTQLKSYYGGLTISKTRQIACLSPTFDRFGDTTLVYKSGNQLPDRLGRAMFNAVAIQRNGQLEIPVKVKFTQQYCDEAHSLLAKKKLAPALLHSERLEYGFSVVVMESIAGETLALRPIQQPIPPSALQDIKQAIKTLHVQDLVFGDLRRPNIILVDRVTDNGVKETGAVLVDFDWAGKHGEQRYPPLLNPGMRWPDDIAGGRIMKKEHDLTMLALLQKHST
ncbi:hypothetical protein FRB99_005580 [Tulasnella sp. 403]|nr:hypothetical protein FRB99_005580 [Tulasnella sp. 403]